MARKIAILASSPTLTGSALSDLLEAVKELWWRFDSSIDHPLKGASVEFDTSRWDGQLALARPLLGPGPNDGIIHVWPALIHETHSDLQLLTVLHESIHLHLLLGIHAPHWQRFQAFRRSNRVDTRATDLDEVNFRDTRLGAALTILGHSDEVYAELFLSEHYPELAASRAGYLESLAIRHALPRDLVGDGLHAYRLFHLAIKLDLCVRLSRRPSRSLLALREAGDTALAPLMTPAMQDARETLRTLALSDEPQLVDDRLEVLAAEILHLPWLGPPQASGYGGAGG